MQKHSEQSVTLTNSKAKNIIQIVRVGIPTIVIMAVLLIAIATVSGYDLRTLIKDLGLMPVDISAPVPVDTSVDNENTVVVEGDVDESTIIQGDGNVIINQAPSTPTPEPSPTPISEFMQTLLDGYYLLKNDELEKADEKFVKARILNPDSAEPWYWSAQVAMEVGLYDEALKRVDKALLKAPNHLYSLALKTKALLLLYGNRQELVEEFVTQNYGGSEKLDQWLDCLNQAGMLSKKYVTPSELDLFCKFPDYNWEEVRGN